MFGQFFNLDESVFSIAPNPKYLYLSKQHEEALAHLVYGVTRKGGFVCLTGDIGTGKTTVCRCMFEQLPENTDIAFVINPKFTPLELLASICDELHIGYSTFQPSIKEYVKKLYIYLIDAHAKGRNTVLVIDEAQNLTVEALEHVRALTNLETNDQKLLQIILIGQPELKTLLARPELEQVNQRITARFHIGPLSLNETNRYIHHRLLVAGAKRTIFSSDNIKQIYKLAKGWVLIRSVQVILPLISFANRPQKFLITFLCLMVSQELISLRLIMYCQRRWRQVFLLYYFQALPFLRTKILNMNLETC